MTEIVTVLSSDVSILSSIAVSRLMPTYAEELSAEGCKFLVSVPTEDTDTGHISKYVNFEQIENSMRSRLGVDDMLYYIKELSANKSDSRYKELGDRGGDFVCETEIQPYIISAICESANGNILSVRGYRLSTAIEEELQNTMHKQISVLNIYSPTIADGTSVNNKIVNQLCVENLVRANMVSHIGQNGDVMYTTPSGPLKQGILNTDILVCDNDEDLKKCMGATMSFQDIYNNWRKGGQYDGKWYGFTDYPDKYVPVTEDGYGYYYWYYEQENDTIVQPNNTNDDSFYYSPTKYQNYDITVRCYSPNGDDDIIGLVLAFVEDGPDGKPRMLLALRSPNTTNTETPQTGYHWYVMDSTLWVYDTTIKNVITCDNIVDEYLPQSNGWKDCGAGTQIRARRNGSKIELWTTPFMKDASRGDVLASEFTNKITLDLSKIADGIFNRPARIGYATKSQPYSKYENIDFNVEKTVVDTRTNTLSTYNPISRTWELKSTGYQTLDTCGFGRLTKNTITQNVFYVTQNGFEKVHVTSTENSDDTDIVTNWQNPHVDDKTPSEKLVYNGLESLSSDIEKKLKELEEKIKSASSSTSFDDIYPVGSIYISVNSSIPTSFKGSWTKLTTGRALWNATSDKQLGAEINGGLPNAQISTQDAKFNGSGAFTGGSTGWCSNVSVYTNNQSLSFNGVEKIQSGIRPTSIGVSMWKRIS